MALLGEFHGIAEQVGDDLPEAADIADDMVWQARVDTHDQFQVLFGDAGRNQRGDVLDRLGKRKRCRVERQLAGIDLREIEDVVDDGEQRVARLDDDVGEGLLTRIELGLGKQFGHTEHAVHRRADFMAHIGEEFRLGAVGCLGLEQRLGGFGKGAADSLFHRAEDPDADGDHGGAEQQARPQKQVFAARFGHAALDIHGRAGARQHGLGEQIVLVADLAVIPVLGPGGADHQIEVAQDVARRPQEVAVDGGGIQFVLRLLGQLRRDGGEFGAERLHAGVEALRVILGRTGECIAGVRVPSADSGFGETGGIVQIAGEGDDVAAQKVDLGPVGTGAIEHDDGAGDGQRQYQQTGKITGPDGPDERRILRHA